jgi:hypothetical protein
MAKEGLDSVAEKATTRINVNNFKPLDIIS